MKIFISCHNYLSLGLRLCLNTSDIFWAIDLLGSSNRLYTNVNYTLQGEVRLLAEASYGKERDGINYSSPIPVLEIFGDCELTWTGTDINNHQVGQVIKYNYALKQWDIKSTPGEKHD